MEGRIKVFDRQKIGEWVREQRAESMEQRAWSREHGAESMEQ